MKRYAIPAHTLNRKIAIAMMNALAVWRLGILSGLLSFAKTGATPYRTYGRSSFMIIRRSVIPKNTPAGTAVSYTTSDAADDLLCVDLGGRRIIKKKKKKKKKKTKKKKKKKQKNKK